MSFFDLVPGQKHETKEAIRITGWTLMTNGNCRVWYEPTPDVKSDPVLQKLDMVEATGDALAVIARHDASISEKRRLERDMASGPGSKRSK